MTSFLKRLFGAPPAPVAPSPDDEARRRREALKRAIEEGQAKDPFVGARLGGAEILQRLMHSMQSTDARGVHIDTLLMMLGACGGYACQASVRALAKARGLPDDAPFVAMDGADGKRYFFGDELNQPLLEAQYSLWAMVAGRAKTLGCTTLPDIPALAGYVASTAGGADFGKPRVPEGMHLFDDPTTILRRLWPTMAREVDWFTPNPTQWPMLFGFAIQDLLEKGKDAVRLEDAVTLVMETAIPMSKVDLGPDAAPR